jgi:hypothetical protein
LDLVGLAGKIFTAVERIDFGRKSLATDGKEHAGRIAYENGLANAMSAFQEAHESLDPQSILFCEYTFLQQELQYCSLDDADSYSSLTNAIAQFDDAFLALKAVSNAAGYKVADLTYPHNNATYRYSGYPRDAFHYACQAHKARMKNWLRTPGTNMTEKTVLKQRNDNMTTAQNSYLKLQEKALKEKKKQ